MGPLASGAWSVCPARPAPGPGPELDPLVLCQVPIPVGRSSFDHYVCELISMTLDNIAVTIIVYAQLAH